MLWSNQIGWYSQRVVYVLYEDGSFQEVFDTFDPDTEPLSGKETPPAGLFEPVLGFGKVWREQPGVREALGWATAAETHGVGRFQIFGSGNDMIWLSQRQETYILMQREKRYTVVNSPTFVLPTPTPPAEYSSLILGRWVDRHLPPGQSLERHEFTFLSDGTMAFHDCVGSYQWSSGNKILIDAENCTSPELSTGLYEYTLDPSGAILILSQRFQCQLLGYGDSRWGQKDNDYGIELWWDTISIKECSSRDMPCWYQERCRGRLASASGCAYLIEQIGCEHGQSPLAAAYYEVTYVCRRGVNFEQAIRESNSLRGKLKDLSPTRKVSKTFGADPSIRSAT